MDTYPDSKRSSCMCQCSQECKGERLGECSHSHRQKSSIARGLHWSYKATLSWLFRGACRFHPTCSDYALEAIEVHGWFRGGRLAVSRLLRCHPYNPGGIDPVP